MGWEMLPPEEPIWISRCCPKSCIEERDRLRSALDALVEHVKYYQMILETTPGKWAAGLSENMKQAIAAAEGR